MVMLAALSGSAWSQPTDLPLALRIDADCPNCELGRTRATSGANGRNGKNGADPLSNGRNPILLRLDRDCPTCQTIDPLRPSVTEAILAIQVNLEAKGDFIVQVSQDGDVLVRETDLGALGISNLPYQRAIINGVAYVSLRGAPGVTLDLDRSRLVLSIRVDPRALARRQVIDLSPQRNPFVRLPAPAGAFFNYNLSRNHDDLTGAGANVAAGELGWRLGEYLLLGDAFVSEDHQTGETRAVRLNTSLTHDRRETLQRLVIGDFVTQPQNALGSSLRLGGLSFSRRFDIDPYYVRFPGQIVSGTAALPSEVFIFSNGALVRRERIAPGTFDLQNLVSVSGLQVTEVVIRDVLGNEQRIVDPFYFTDTLLREGVDEYSVDIGAERLNFGVRSNDYGDLGFSGFYRLGVSDALTLGARAEALDGRYNLGPTATLRLGTYGIASASVAFSSGALGDGAALSLAHTYQSLRAGAGIALRLEERTYARAASAGFLPRRYDFSATASRTLSATSSIGIAYITSAFWTGPSTRTTSLSYRYRFTRDVSVGATARRTSGRNAGDELLLSLNWNLDGPFDQRPVVTAQAQRQNGRHVETLQAAGGNPDAEGLLYRMTVERQRDNLSSRTVLNPLAQYNFPRATLRAEAFHDSFTRATRTEVALQGGIAAIGGEWSLARPIRDSFGIVKVGELEGIRVFSNNQPIGRTGPDGTVFVPRLASYFENPIAIEVHDLPFDTIVPENRVIVAPALRSGVLVDFKARRVSAVAGKLMRRGGETPRPFGDAEGRLSVEGRELSLFTSRDGSFYVEDVPPGRYSGEASWRGERCRFELNVPESKEVVIALGEVRCAN